MTESTSAAFRNKIALNRFIKSHDGASTGDMVEAINIKLNLSVLADNESHHHRLYAGRMLLELRTRVEAEGEDWWTWQKGKFDRSRKDMEKLMRMARADEPEMAAQAEREETRSRMARLRNGAHVRSMDGEAGVLPKPKPVIADLDEDEADDDEDQMRPAELAKGALMALELRVEMAKEMGQGCLVVMPRIKKAKLKAELTNINATLVAWRAVAELAAEEANEPPVDPAGLLSKTALERLEAFKRQYKKKLDAEFVWRVRSDLKRRVDELVMPSLRARGRCGPGAQGTQGRIQAGGVQRDPALCSSRHAADHRAEERSVPAAAREPARAAIREGRAAS
jgi:hypothetical protein